MVSRVVVACAVLERRVSLARRPGQQDHRSDAAEQGSLRVRHARAHLLQRHLKVSPSEAVAGLSQGPGSITSSALGSLCYGERKLCRDATPPCTLYYPERETPTSGEEIDNLELAGAKRGRALLPPKKPMVLVIRTGRLILVLPEVELLCAFGPTLVRGYGLCRSAPISRPLIAPRRLAGEWCRLPGAGSCRQTVVATPGWNFASGRRCSTAA